MTDRNRTPINVGDCVIVCRDRQWGVGWVREVRENVLSWQMEARVDDAPKSGDVSFEPYNFKFFGYYEARHIQLFDYERLER